MGARRHAYCAMPALRSSTFSYGPESRGLPPSYQYARLATEAIPPRRGMGADARSREPGAPGRVGGGRQSHGRPARPVTLLEVRRGHATDAKHLPELRGVAALRST